MNKDLKRGLFDETPNVIPLGQLVVTKQGIYISRRPNATKAARKQTDHTAQEDKNCL